MSNLQQKLMPPHDIPPIMVAPKMIEVSERAFTCLVWELHWRRYLTIELIQIAEACAQLNKSPEEQLRHVTLAVEKFNNEFKRMFGMTNEEMVAEMRDQKLASDTKDGA